MAILHRWRSVALALMLSLMSAGAFPAPVVALKLQDAIGPASADYLVRGIRKASESGAPLVVIQLDTPGGLDTSMRQVIQAILASPVPVAVYVSPEGSRAASAGTYILYAAHIAAMAPATTLGAATPVAIGMPGSDRKTPADKPASGASSPASGSSAPAAGLGDAMTAKQVHDAAAFIRGLAQLRGRNGEWAERAVREAVSLTAPEALQLKVIDVVAKDLPDLLALIDGRTVRVLASDHRLATRGATVEVRLPDWRQKALAAVTHPSVALILMMIGIWGLFFEFSSPGHGIPGVTGAISLLVALFALQLLPINYAALGLLLLGMALLIAEVLSPSFGVLGVGGIVALVAGGLLLFDEDATGFSVPVPLVVGLALASAAVVILGGGMALKARRKPVVSGPNVLLGAVGEVLQVSAGEAWAEVQGERWKVIGEGPFVAGQRIRVVGLDGLTLRVQPLAETQPQGDFPS